MSLLKKYNVIYADPPWNFKNYSKKGEGRNPNAHYDCMDFKQLSNLPIENLASNNCTLFLWVTDPILEQAMKLVNIWGFKFKTVGFYWVKINKNSDVKKLNINKDFFTGLGYWTRANPEQCWIATKGKPKRLNKDVSRILIDKRREHSRKPEQIYNRIERLVKGPYIELFARNSRKGWDNWGKEVKLFDRRGIIKTRRKPSNLKSFYDKQEKLFKLK